jgi:hypothetical protein
MSATTHFIGRVAERIGAAVDPRVLADGIVWAIRQERDDIVEFVTRVDRRGCRIFRFRVPDGRQFYALVNTDEMRCITVLPPGFTVPRQGKSRMKLKETDI